MARSKHFVSAEMNVAGDSVADMYTSAANFGVREFLVHGTHPATVGYLRQLLSRTAHIHDPVFYVTGFTPHGTFLRAVDTFAQGLSWHAILDHLPANMTDLDEISNYFKDLDK